MYYLVIVYLRIMTFCLIFAHEIPYLNRKIIYYLNFPLLNYDCSISVSLSPCKKETKKSLSIIQMFSIILWLSYCEDKTSGWMTIHVLSRFMNHMATTCLTQLSKTLSFLRALNVYIYYNSKQGLNASVV